MSLGLIDLTLPIQELVLSVAKPNKSIICRLKEAYSASLNVKLGNINELTFSVPYEIEIGHELKPNPHIELLKDRYLIKVEYAGQVDWYMIVNNKDNSADTIKNIKNVKALLLPYELSDKNIHVFREDGINIETILEGGKAIDSAGQTREVVGILSNSRWKLGYVDGTIAIKYRSYEFTSTNALDCLFSVAEKLNAIITWDTFNHKINFYDADTYGTNKGLIINYNNYLNSINKEVKSDEMVTRLKMFGKDDISINRVNLTGQNYIEDYSFFMFPFDRAVNKDSNKIKSGSLNVWDTCNIDKIVEDVKKLELNAVNVPVKIDIPTLTSTEMKINENSKLNAIKIIKKLTDIGIKTILEPYPFINNGKYIADDYSPNNIDLFFKNWKTLVLNPLIIDIGNKLNTYAMVVSSNLKKIEYESDYWIDIINYVKSIYQGLVTYKTSWWITATWAENMIQDYNNKLENNLFGKVDFISISCYFELTEKEAPSVDELKNAIFSSTIQNRGQNIYQEVKNFYDKWKKPIFFGELGFSNFEKCAQEPWNQFPSDKTSNIAQANCFQAYKEVFENESWLKGFSVLFIGHDKDENGYFPVGKPAEHWIRSWYKNEVYIVAKHSDYMSDELCQTILDFTSYLQLHESNFANLLKDVEGQQRLKTKLVNEKYILDEELQKLIDIRDLDNYANKDTTNQNEEISKKKIEVENKQKEITDVENKIKEISFEIQKLRKSFGYNKFFTPKLLEELNKFIIEKEWTDDKFDVDSELYTEGKKYFEKIKQPQMLISIELDNFLNLIEAQKDWGKLVLGDNITIRLDKMNINVTAKIIEYTINFENRSISISIANTKDIMSDEEKLMKLIYSTSQAAATVDISKSKWDGIKETRSQVEEMINNTWDSTKRAILAGNNNEIEIGPRGIMIRDKSDPESYLVIQNGLIAITNDEGATWKHAITKDGIVAERIYGKLIAGVNLKIDASDKDGVKTFTVDGSGVTIAGSKLTITGGISPDMLDPAFKDGLINIGTNYNGVVIDYKEGLVITKSDGMVRTVLNASEGFKFQKSTGSDWKDMLYYDALSGNLTVDGSINARELKINGVNVLVDSQIDGKAINKIKVEQLDATTAKIKTSQIEKLEVGTNVTMGSNAYISWSQITSKPHIPQSASEIGAIPKTYIDSRGVWTGFINANSIIAGTIKASLIDTESLKISRLYENGNSNNYLIFNNGLRLFNGGRDFFRIQKNGRHVNMNASAEEGGGVLFLSTDGLSTSIFGRWDFSNASVNGLNAVATFG
ncbi:hypothetical protein B7C51_25265 (plasmid) [Paenibacillus larvae subsp. pulvifaciens]|uniref:YOMG-like N-terminal domain-containing protein n=1 Tax=Paenibacillus larvae subsp. pulvifaciens TaxID=1477 RepID=A0A1V0V084_9BACL|nr:phage tail spike protein [Paenibacillus larvae]ARF70783.1 hypothetical protein B7C51_25265 [Paenibacillus larvae subsp. pulvifaciens]